MLAADSISYLPNLLWPFRLDPPNPSRYRPAGLDRKCSRTWGMAWRP